MDVTEKPQPDTIGPFSSDSSDVAALFKPTQDSLPAEVGNELAHGSLADDIDANELNDILEEGGGNIDLNTLNDQQLAGGGEKADDAEDFADISNDDLAEEENNQVVDDKGQTNRRPPAAAYANFPFVGEDDMLDLFGDGPSSPPSLPYQRPVSPNKEPDGIGGVSDLASDADDDDDDDAARDVGSSNLLDTVDQPVVDPQWLLQQAALAEALQPTKNEQQKLEEAIQACATLFPEFRRGEVPYWSRIIVPHMTEYVGKTPLKPPKPIRPTKVHLELQEDQKAAFNSFHEPDKPYWQDYDRLIINDTDQASMSKQQRVAQEDMKAEEILPGNLTMQDLDMICVDLATLTEGSQSDIEDHSIVSSPHVVKDDHKDDLFEDDDCVDSGWLDSTRSAKRRKLDIDPTSILSRQQYALPLIDEPEDLTQKLSGKVVLDLNDPLLLTEEMDSTTLLANDHLMNPSSRTQNMKELLRCRFNHSNDAEYDLLKQNHQNKIRSTLGNLSVEHSVPAARLQYPYFQLKLNSAAARTFHRPSLTFRPMLSFHFSKGHKIKRKHQKGRKTNEIYASTRDLSLGDNSTCLVLEYSEEHPMILSQVGMGTRIINYYRRRTRDDASRPKLDIGETAVLLPEDKSPFSMFGNIEAGETISAVYNSMYRAPIFEHPPPIQDFLVTRNHTGMAGFQFHLRKIEHIYTVGQQFPSTVVPGPHSRAVTTASKNRLKMVSYRIARRKKNHRLNVAEVTKHFPETTDMQNRQKMKEFMMYSKEHKEWEVKPGETIPDEESLQQLVKPEDVCLLESMQVGQQYLRDAGFGGDDGDEDDDDKEGQGQSVEQELAPWKTSKNFLNASQGKAMLTLHGDGDPSGRGEAFAFLKTSMKGGFKAIGESAMSKMEEKKELGGHSYNVARQQRAYDESIRRIWNAQKAALSSNAEHSDIDMDDNVDGPDEGGTSNVFAKPIPPSEVATPAAFSRRDDETMTSFSKRSTTSNTRDRVLKIIRQVKRADGAIEEVEHIERDPLVIKQYLKRRNAKYAASRSWVHDTAEMNKDCRTLLTAYRLAEVSPTGIKEQDDVDQKRYVCRSGWTAV